MNSNELPPAAAGPIARSLLEVSARMGVPVEQMRAVINKVMAECAELRKLPRYPIEYSLMGLEESACNAVLAWALAAAGDVSIARAMAPIRERIEKANADFDERQSREALQAQVDFQQRVAAKVARLSVAQLVAEIEQELGGKLMVREDRIALQGGRTDGWPGETVMKIRARRDEIVTFLGGRDEVREIET